MSIPRYFFDVPYLMDLLYEERPETFGRYGNRILKRYEAGKLPRTDFLRFINLVERLIMDEAIHLQALHRALGHREH